MNRGKPLARTSRLEPGTPPARRTPLARNAQMAAVSGKRARENRQRAAMADRRWPDRRNGTVMCGCGRPECHRRADDLHETLSRARSGGDITNPDIWVPLARECHTEITLGPDWAYKRGLLKHDGVCCEGRAVCAQYEENGDAA